MSRPRKCRRVCFLPEAKEFTPKNGQENVEPVILKIDEYEAIRLIDKEGLSQEECSQSMEVARTTVQQIYTDARKKLALCLVEGLPLKIEGGDYRLCEEDELCCRCGFCHQCGKMCSKKTCVTEEE